MTEKTSTILSLKYQDQITTLCNELQRATNIPYFVSYIIFNNGQLFVLSNLFDMLPAYYTEGLHKEDFSIEKEHTADVSYYLCDRTPSISENFKTLLEQKYTLHRAYYIVRNCPECQFVFGAIKNNPIEDYQRLYTKTLPAFEKFCCYFINNVVDIIKHHNPTYKASLVLNDADYRKRIIQTPDAFSETPTAREIECLCYAAYGKSSEETAQILGISKMTVEGYRNDVKRKLNAENITQAVFEAVKHGYIGAFDKIWKKKDVAM